MKTRALLLAIWFFVSTTPTPAKLKDPIFVSPDFNPALVEQISVFVADLNNDEAHNSKCIYGAEYGALDGGIGAGKSLRKRGYYRKGDKSVYRYYKAEITPSAAMLANPTREWLQDLAHRKYFDSKGKEVPPPPERWIMFITIDELGSSQSVKDSGRTLSMYLYDRDQGTLLWHDQESDKNIIFKGKGAMYMDTCATLVEWMVLKLPKRKN